MRVLVTGGCGFIGSHLVELLIRKGQQVLVLDDLSTGRLEWLNSTIKRKSRMDFDMCAVQTWSHVEPVVKAFKPTAICHLAAQPAISTSWTDPLLNADVNEMGTLNMLLAAREHGVRRFVFASTSAVYADGQKSLPETAPVWPESPYGISKFAGEAYVRTLFPRCVVLRLGNVYGPRQVPIGENQVVPLMMRHFTGGNPFAIYGDGRQTRDYVYVGDVADAFFKSLWGLPGTYNIATGKQTTVNDLGRMLGEIYNAPGYPWEHTDEQDPRRGVPMKVSSAMKGLGWEAQVPLRQGLEQTARWWNEQRPN